jgi:hypothetical protein
MHDTQIYGLSGEDGSRGLLYSISRFLGNNPDWFVCYHAWNNHGFTVLGRLPEDKPTAPVDLVLPVMTDIETPALPAPPPMPKGPGTELKRIFSDLGINSSPDCACNAKANEMDIWGVQKCRENVDNIVQWLRENQEKYTWKDRIAAAAKAVTTGLAFKLNILDPFPSLVAEAIARAEAKEQEEAVNKYWLELPPRP